VRAISLFIVIGGRLSSYAALPYAGRIGRVATNRAFVLPILAYSALLGAIAGVMISGYYLVRTTQLNLADLFKVESPYKGWSIPALIAFTASTLPVVPGFLATVKVVEAESVGPFLMDLNSYAWSVTVGLSLLIYYILSKYSSRVS
jgi:NCS1 family nucleobase:cation symporter-1